jgi:HSP20 family molecular chaperone IbpA
MKKPSLIDRLTGIVGGNDEYEDFFEDEEPIPMGTYSNPAAAARAEQEHATRLNPTQQPMTVHQEPSRARAQAWQTELEHANEGELAVDVYQTADFVVVKALVAGVPPTNLDISLSRDMITIQGTREDEREAEDNNYFQRELYWGGFSRTILLPEEVDVDMADASEKHGILVIRLPKINKAKQTKLKVRTK